MGANLILRNDSVLARNRCRKYGQLWGTPTGLSGSAALFGAVAARLRPLRPRFAKALASAISLRVSCLTHRSGLGLLAGAKGGDIRRRLATFQLGTASSPCWDRGDDESPDHHHLFPRHAGSPSTTSGRCRLRPGARAGSAGRKTDVGIGRRIRRPALRRRRDHARGHRPIRPPVSR